MRRRLCGWVPEVGAGQRWALSVRHPRIREGGRLRPYLARGPAPTRGKPRPRGEGAQAGRRSGSGAPRARASLPHAFVSGSAAFSVYLWKRPVRENQKLFLRRHLATVFQGGCPGECSWRGPSPSSPRKYHIGPGLTLVTRRVAASFLMFSGVMITNNESQESSVVANIKCTV